MRQRKVVSVHFLVVMTNLVWQKGAGSLAARRQAGFSIAQSYGVLDPENQLSHQLSQRVEMLAYPESFWLRLHQYLAEKLGGQN